MKTRYKHGVLVITATAFLLSMFALPGCDTVESVVTTTEEIVGTVADSATTATTATTENADTHDDPADYVWDEVDVIDVTLNGSSASSNSAAVLVEAGTVTITEAGTYRFSGTLSDGQIVVNTSDDEVVRIILNGVDISNSSSAAIYVVDAKKAVIVLADGTSNSLSDGSSYTYADVEAEEPNATLFSTADLTIFGEGLLVVEGNFNDAIASKDGLIIASGTITVDAVDDGIRGKDYLVVSDGQITVEAGGDGLKSDNDEDATKGYIQIAAGAVAVTAGGDGLDAETDVIINGGSVSVTSGGGSSGSVSEDTSAKGIKGAVSVVISGGELEVDSADDALHSNESIVIDGGTFVLASGDDAMHADTTLEINDGTIEVTEAYEGIESAAITINGGNIDLTCSDDGINAGGGNDASGMTMGNGRPGRDGFTGDASGDYMITITGGTIVIDAEGDGVDSNGSIEMTGGTVIVHGPSRGGNGSLDCNGTLDLSGGFLIAVSSTADMVESITSPSTQAAIVFTLNGGLEAGTLIHIEDASCTEVLTFEPEKSVAAVVFSSSELVEGDTYDVYFGGSATGESFAGLYSGGTYSGGENAGSIEAYVP